MNKIINFLGKKVTNAFSNALLDLHKLAKELEETDFEKEFESLKSSFNDILQKKKDKYILEVKYDRDTQTLQFKIEDNLLSVIVEEKTENNKFESKSVTTVTIPNDVILDKITQEYDSERKMMIFKMKKFHSKVENEEKVKQDETIEQIKDDKKPMTSDELLEVIVGMYKDGASFRAIAKEVGLSDKTVAKYIKRVLGENK